MMTHVNIERTKYGQSKKLLSNAINNLITNKDGIYQGKRIKRKDKYEF